MKICRFALWRNHSFRSVYGDDFLRKRYDLESLQMTPLRTPYVFALTNFCRRVGYRWNSVDVSPQLGKYLGRITLTRRPNIALLQKSGDTAAQYVKARMVWTFIDWPKTPMKKRQCYTLKIYTPEYFSPNQFTQLGFREPPQKFYSYSSPSGEIPAVMEPSTIVKTP